MNSDSKESCHSQYIFSMLWSERENQQDATVRCLFLTISQHVRASLCPSSGEQDVCYCMCCAALLLLDVFGSGCGALSCRVCFSRQPGYHPSQTAP